MIKMASDLPQLSGWKIKTMFETPPRSEIVVFHCRGFMYIYSCIGLGRDSTWTNIWLDVLETLNLTGCGRLKIRRHKRNPKVSHNPIPMTDPWDDCICTDPWMVDFYGINQLVNILFGAPQDPLIFFFWNLYHFLPRNAWKTNPHANLPQLSQPTLHRDILFFDVAMFHGCHRMGEEIREAWTKYKASLPINPEISFFWWNERIFVITLLPGTLKNQILITSLTLGGKGLEPYRRVSDGFFFVGDPNFWTFVRNEKWKGWVPCLCPAFFVGIWKPWIHGISIENYINYSPLKLTANAPENRVSQKETIIFQPFIFRGYVGFREGKKSEKFIDPLLLKPAHVDRVAVLPNQFPYEGLYYQKTLCGRWF